MSAFVLDASTAVSWCFEETQTPYALSVLSAITAGATVHVPGIWPLEVTNALVRAFRRRRIQREELMDYARQFARIGVQVDFDSAEERAYTDVLLLAEKHQLTTYDASYLELAKRLNLPLATADHNLIQAANAIQVNIFEPPASVTA